MSKTTLKILNPTGARVTYVSHDARLAASPGESTHLIDAAKAESIKSHFARHYPLLTVEIVAPEKAPALQVPEPPAPPESDATEQPTTEDDKPAGDDKPAKAEGKTSRSRGSRAKSASADTGPTDSEASGE